MNRYLSLLAAVAILADCSAGGSQLAPTTMRSTAALLRSRSQYVDPKTTIIARNGVVGKLVENPFKGTSLKSHWGPNCCAHIKLAFISDLGTSPASVHVYSWPDGTYMTDLAPPPFGGFLEPQGMCVNKTGDVAVTDTITSVIHQYSHSGKFLHDIDDPNELPDGCAYDRTTGDLAVANFGNTNPSEGQGGISIYSSGSAYPTEYTDKTKHIYRAYFLGYDNTGTLWVSGRDSNLRFSYASFSGGSFTPVTITGGSSACGGPPCFPGTVQWSGKTKTMNVGDQDGASFGTPTYYQVDQKGTVTGSTTLKGICDVVQAWVEGARILAPDTCSRATSIWDNPSGKLYAKLSYPGVSPIGSAVSAASPK